MNKAAEQSRAKQAATDEAVHVEGDLVARVGHVEALLREAEHARVVVVQDEHRGRARVRERRQPLLRRRLRALVLQLQAVRVRVVRASCTGQKTLIDRNFGILIGRLET